MEALPLINPLAMRLNLTLSKNRENVPFNHLPVLAGALHKWLGPNDVHDGLSLYSFSWLQGAVANKEGLQFPNGATWHISAVDADFLTSSIKGVFADPQLRWGMQVTQATVIAPPYFEDQDEVRFLLSSPILIKRLTGDGGTKHYLYTDPESDALLTETLQYKLDVAGLPSEGVEVHFDRNYPKAKTQLLTYRGIDNKCSYCPVWVKGSAVQLAFAWTVGLGNSTGVGFGSLMVK